MVLNDSSHTTKTTSSIEVQIIIILEKLLYSGEIFVGQIFAEIGNFTKFQNLKFPEHMQSASTRTRTMLMRATVQDTLTKAVIFAHAAHFELRENLHHSKISRYNYYIIARHC